MPFTGIVHPAQITMLKRVLDEYCAEQHIMSEAAHADAASRIMELFMSGVDRPDALAAALRTEPKLSRYG